MEFHRYENIFLEDTIRFTIDLFVDVFQGILFFNKWLSFDILIRTGTPWCASVVVHPTGMQGRVKRLI